LDAATKGSLTPYLLSSVLDITFRLSATRQSKQSRRGVSYRKTFVLTTETDSDNTTYALCPRVDIDNKLCVDHSTPQRSLWVFMMRKVEAEDFPVYIVPVDLEESKKKIGYTSRHVQCKQTAHSSLG